MFNEEAEQGLIGCIFAKNEIMLDVAGIITAEDFMLPVHGEIFTDMQERINRGATASPVTLKAKFDNHPDLHGMPFYLAELASHVVSTVNAPEYANLIADLSEKRRMAKLIEEAQMALQGGDIISVRTNLLAGLESSTRKSDFVKTKQQVAIEAMKTLELPKTCNPVGIASLDKAMSGGLYHGFTYGFAAQEKMGKTTLAHTISHNLNNSGVKHAYIALEMGAAQIEQRNMARDIGVNSLKFLNNPDSIKKDAAKYISTLQDNTLYLDMPACHFTQIKSEIMRLVAKKKVDGFILDYWQLIGGGEEDRPAFLYKSVQWIADFCRKHGVWSIVVAQLNRDGKLYGSSGLEKACDQLYTIGAAEDNYHQDARFMKMTHSRYTPTVDIGNPEYPRFLINKIKGPYMEEII